MPVEPVNRFATAAGGAGSEKRAASEPSGASFGGAARSTGSAPGSASGQGSPNAGPAAVERLRDDLSELGEYARHYLAARADTIRLSVRRAGIFAVLGVVGLIASAAYVVTATTLVILGIARGLGLLFGGHEWLGYLVTGGVFLGAFAMAVNVIMTRLTNSSRERMVQAYARRREEQDRRFGHNVRDRAARTE